MKHILLSLLGFLALAPTSANAQAERYELGRRLKLLEHDWEAHPQPEARKRALADLPKATKQFLSFQLSEAGRTLDTARFALLAQEAPAPDRLSIETIFFSPNARLVDAKTENITLRFQQFYKPDSALPEQLQVELQWPNEKPVAVKVEKFPMKVEVSLPKFTGEATDIPLSLIVRAGKHETKHSVLISRIADIAARIAKLKAIAKDAKAPTIESATLNDRVDLLTQLLNGQTLETDYPAAKLLLEAEAIANAGLNKSYFTSEKPGQFWFSVPNGKTEQTACRIFVPKNLEMKKPVPVVFALHGAGGSENLFFEGYGAGQIVKECEKRGWLLVATRSPLGFGFGYGPPVLNIVEVLKERYPIDTKNIFLVGHSMGAGHVLSSLNLFPNRFAAAAMLGGGGNVRKPEAFQGLPIFVGVGSEDFALSAAKNLKKGLTDAKANLTYREYAGIEHMVIVREALPDVFALFDTLMKPKK